MPGVNAVRGLSLLTGLFPAPFPAPSPRSASLTPDMLPVPNSILIPVTSTVSAALSGTSYVRFNLDGTTRSATYDVPSMAVRPNDSLGVGVDVHAGCGLAENKHS